jgi:hypothetical protein
VCTCLHLIWNRVFIYHQIRSSSYMTNVLPGKGDGTERQTHTEKQARDQSDLATSQGVARGWRARNDPVLEAAKTEGPGLLRFGFLMSSKGLDGNGLASVCSSIGRWRKL